MNKEVEITRLEETLDELTASVSDLSGDELNWLSGERAYTNAIDRVRTLALKADHEYRERGEPTPQHVESAMVFMLGEQGVERAFAESEGRILSRGIILVEDEAPLTGARLKVIGIAGGGSNAVNRITEGGIKGTEFLVNNNDQNSFSSDSELLLATKTTRNAADKLVQKHTERLNNLITLHLQRKNCNQPTVHVQEVLSDIWISVLRHFDNLQEPKRFEQWLFTIGRNEANRHLRSCIGGQVSSVQITEGFLGPPAQISDYYHSRDAAIDADRMLTYAYLISEEFGSIFRLHNEGLGFDEIARRLGKNQEPIRTQYYRGLRKLKARFKQETH